MFADQHGLCWLCGTQMVLEFENGNPWCATYDHLLPLSHNGTWEPENLLLAHQDCNNRRANNRHVVRLTPPQTERTFTFFTPKKRRRSWTLSPATEVRPDRPSAELPWTKQWMIDKGLMRS